MDFRVAVVRAPCENYAPLSRTVQILNDLLSSPEDIILIFTILHTSGLDGAESLRLRYG